MMTDRTSICYLKWFAVPVLIFLIIAIPLSIFFEPLSGDLTRIGYWSERDFGWNKPQPAVSIRANGTLISNPQILVLGDSFSHPNIWQSYLAKARNFDILSFQYQDVGCVDNWLNWVVEKDYPNMHTVIIQIAERSFVPTFRNINTCANQLPKPLKISKEDVKPTRPNSGFMFDATYLSATAMNMLRMRLSDGNIASAKVINAALSTDRLFSNRKSNRLLYYAEDENKRYWTDQEITKAIKNLKSIQDKLANEGVWLEVIVVPDKSTVYRKYLIAKADTLYPNIFEKLKVSGVNNVNLLSFFQSAVVSTVDLYLPNDTHLSTHGYKLMASKVANDLL